MDNDQVAPATKRHKQNDKQTTISYNAIDYSSPQQSFAKYLMATSTDSSQSLTKTNPFKLAKAINEKITGKLNNVTTLSNGFLLLECNNSHQSTILQNTKSLNNIPVSITPHKTMNFSKGVIRCRDIHEMTSENIIAELHDQGVIDSRRISIKRDGQTIETHTYILTFNTLQLPKIINVGYQIVRVEKYIPPPLQCRHCLLYGHTETKCRRQVPRCARCGENHKLNECHQESIKCIHCSGEHLSFSKSCPKWKTEQEIVTLKHTLNLTFPEARKRIQQKTGISYASVATKSYKSSATQTEISMSSHTFPAPQTSTVPKTISQTNSQTKPSSENKTPSTDLSSTKSSPEKQTSSSRSRSRQRQRNTTTSLPQHTTPTSNRYVPLESMEQDEVSTLNSSLTAKRNHPPDKT